MNILNIRTTFSALVMTCIFFVHLNSSASTNPCVAYGGTNEQVCVQNPVIYQPEVGVLNQVFLDPDLACMAAANGPSGIGDYYGGKYFSSYTSPEGSYLGQGCLYAHVVYPWGTGSNWFAQNWVLARGYQTVCSDPNYVNGRIVFPSSGICVYSCPVDTKINPVTYDGCYSTNVNNTVADTLNVSKTPNTCEVKLGHPISPFVGAETDTISTGLSIGGQALLLTYDNRKVFSAASAGLTPQAFGNMPGFGALWESSLHRNIKFGAGRFGVQLFTGNGRVVNFQYNTSTSLYASSADVSDKLEVIGSNFRYTQVSSKTAETYNNAGQLTTVSKADGTTLSYTYSNAASTIAPAANYLTQVSDNTGRSIRFEYNLPVGGVAATDGLVSRIIDPAGQAITTTYDAQRNLTSLTWADGKTQTYVYENAALPWAMTGSIDERGIRFSTYAYDAQGRAISTELGSSGANKYTASYTSAPQTQMTQSYDAVTGVTTRAHDWVAPTGVVVTLPNGQTSNLSTASAQGLTLLSGSSQPAGSGCAASTSARTYDTNGNSASADDFNGTRSCFSNDMTRNVRTVDVSGLANTVSCAGVLPANSTLPNKSRKVSTQYHPDSAIAIKIAAPLSITTSVYNGQPDPFNGYAIASCAPAAAVTTDGKPIMVLCNQITQATTDTNGRLGFSATLDFAVAVTTTSYTYDTAGRVLTATDSLGKVTTFTYYPTTVMGGLLVDNRVSLLLHLDGLSGSTSVVDDSSWHKVIVPTGDAKISTTQSRFGGSSIYFPGTKPNRSYLSIPSGDATVMGASDFTIEMWIYKAAGPVDYSKLWSPNGDLMGIYIGFAPNGNLVTYGATLPYKWDAWAFASGIPVPDEVWTHVALQRSEGTVTFFVNGIGTVVTSTLGVMPLYDSGLPSVIGNQGNGPDRAFTGYVDEIRITKGLPRYSGDFTPSMQAFVNTGLVNTTSVGHTIGDLQTITNPAGQVTQFTKYDPSGRLLESIDSKGIVTTNTYTPRGWISSTTVTPPAGVARLTSYTYDPVGQLTAVSTPDGQTVGYTYDAAHRLVGASDTKGNSVAYTLDNMGNRVGEQMKDPQGVLQRSMTRAFDALNRVQQVTGQ